MKQLRLCWIITTLIVAMILLSFLTETEARRRGRRGRGLLKESRRSFRSKLPLKPEFTRRRKFRRRSECRLGRSVYEIGDTWNPDLGAPFGVMHCIQCKCEGAQRKRRIVGKVRCKDVRRECPKLDCADAVNVPGQCCKACPNSRTYIEKTNADATIEENESKDNNREYAALLTPRSAAVIKSSTGLGESLRAGVASGRFLFKSRSLHYSFVYSEELPRPKYIQFVDPEGNVVEEQEVTINHYQRSTRKICGIWKKLPRAYRKLLKKEQLYAALVTEKINGDNDRYLIGLVGKKSYVKNEMYSSLLKPATQVGTGGMALVQVSPATGSVYLDIVFNGDFNETKDVRLVVNIGGEDSLQNIEEAFLLHKIDYVSNSVTMTSILPEELLASLSHGSLSIVVYSPNNPYFKLIGDVQSRTTCDTFDTILSAADSSSTSVGLAWVYPLPDGSWTFNVQVAPEHKPLYLEMGRAHGKLEKLPFPMSQNITREVVKGMDARHYELLYENNLYLRVVTSNGTNLKGWLSWRPFSDALTSNGPLLLQSNPKMLQENVRTQGLVWLGLDEDCSMNFELSLTNRPQNDVLRLELMEMPELHKKGIPVNSYVLDTFEESNHDGSFHDLNRVSFAHLKAGDAELKVVRDKDSVVLAKSGVSKMIVPNSCLPDTMLNSIREWDFTLEHEDVASTALQDNKCYYDGRLHNEFSQWTPANDSCQICNCHKGTTKCEPVICPKLNCNNPVFVTGECCRSCLNSENNSPRGCNIKGDRFRPAGSTWHPYLPPHGYSVCVTCSCREDTLEVECMRDTCPPLDCPEKLAYFENPLDCCKKCPVEKLLRSDGNPRGKTENQVLETGGCKFQKKLYTNGQVWKHRVEPFGVVPCIECRCNNGKTKCGRKKCPILDCEIQVKEEGACCKKCSTVSTAPSSSVSKWYSHGKSSSSRHRNKKAG